MLKSTKQGFTLVELIVVIVILATLATVAFITLQDYPIQARDSKRTQDVGSIAQKMATELAGGQIAMKDLLASETATLTMSGEKDLAGNDQNYVGAYGPVNYETIGESAESFGDPTTGNSYLALYIEGGTGTGKVKCFEVASMKEIDDTPILKGNCNIYYDKFVGEDSGDLFSMVDGVDNLSVDTTSALYTALKGNMSN